jgi:predicted nucleic acid-binding protein
VGTGQEGGVVKRLFDTSFLVAALLKTHPAHKRVAPWMQRVIDGIDVGFVSTHSLAELYATLTALPVQPRVSPKEAQELIKQKVFDVFHIISLSEYDYLEVINHLSESSKTGGIIYDALIIHAARKAKVEQVITLNEKDFRRVYPEVADKIVSP